MTCDCKDREKGIHYNIILARAQQWTKVKKEDTFIYKMRLEPMGYIYNFAPVGSIEIKEKDIVKYIRHK